MNNTKTIRKKYRIGIIGAGSIVESCHLPVLKNLPDVEISWIFDSNRDRTNLLSKMYNVPILQGMWQDGIEDIDICLLTIPYGARLPYIELIAAKKKALYVEKPFALTVYEHERWNKMFAGPQLAIGFQRRYYSIVEELRQIISSCIFGQLAHISFKQGYFSLKGGSSYLSDAKLSGGGVIIESAIHVLDQLLCITGAHDISVSSVKSIEKKGIDYDTIFETDLHIHDKRVPVYAHITTLQNLDNGLCLHFEHAIVSTNLAVETDISIIPASNTLSVNGNIMRIAAVNKPPFTVIGSFGIFWKEYLSALNIGKPNLTSCQASLLTSKWIELIYDQIK